MKRILFLIPSFQLGGTNSALNNFLSKIDKRKFQVDVYAFDDNGPNRPIVDKYAHIIGGNNGGQTEGKVNQSSLKDLVRGIKRFLYKMHIDISPLVFRRVARQLSGNHYDTVIAFQEGQTTKFLTYFRDTFKVAWIHCDYQDHLSINKVSPEINIYSKIDRIVCVSSYTKDSFLAVLPEMQDKTLFLHNAMDVERIKKLSEASLDIEVSREEGCFNLVSIGRLDPVKRFDQIPVIASKLKESGLRFRWFIIGNGPEHYRGLIDIGIKEYKVEDSVFCLGAKSNPYPYIKFSDVVVITSSSEACPVVLNEAKVLQVPVVTTNYGSSYEFIKDGENGVICTIDDMPGALRRLFEEKGMYSRIKNNLSIFEYPNSAIIEKLENIILKN